jgi:phenylacetate-CoA ligase
VVERKGIMDEITIRIEVTPDSGGKELEQVKARLRENLKVKTNLSFHVQMEPPGSLPRYMLKATRFKDRRESER